MKITDRIEKIFAHAAALQQSGRLRNTIYCAGSDVYILNQDHTVLLRFRLRDTDRAFEQAVSFDASDYDSQELVEKDGRVNFVQRSGDYCRTKSCRAPKYSADQVADILKKFGKPSGDKVVLPATVLGLLDDSLSHLEFSSKGGHFSIVQRNVYTGSVTMIDRSSGKGFQLMDRPVEDFGPLGLRTADFLALYAFDPAAIGFWFGSKGAVHFKSDDPRTPMTGVISQCIYDELGGELED